MQCDAHYNAQIMRGAYLTYLFRFFSFLSLPVSHGFGWLLGSIVSLFPGRTRSIVEKNINLCFPSLSAKQKRQLRRRALVETAKSIFELGALWVWPSDKVLSKVVEVHNESLVSDAIDSGRGVLLATAHLGAWEMIGLYSSTRYPMTSMYRKPRLEGLDSWMKAARERAGATLVPADAGGVRLAYKALKSGELVCILPDQEPKVGEGQFSPFFGVDALTMSLFSRLAAKTRPDVIFGWVERLPFGRGYRIHYSKIDQAVLDSDIARSTAALNQHIEAQVRLCPSQYQWTYRRFRARPDGQPPIY